MLAVLLISATAGAAEPKMHWLLQPEHVDHLTVHDSAGKQSGGMNGLVQFWHGRDVAALTFDGLHNAIVSTPAKEVLPDKALTVSAWVMIEKPQVSSGIVGLFQKAKPHAVVWGLGTTDGKLTFTTPQPEGPPAVLTGKTPIEPQRWYHVSATAGAGGSKLFVDGRLDGAGEAATGELLPAFAAELLTGATRTGERIVPLHGMIHEVAIYGEALDQSQIRKLYEQKSQAFPAPLEIAVGPHVEFTSRTDAVIRWETSSPTASVVAFGQDQQLARQVANEGQKTKHAVTLTSLSPDSVYAYQIRDSSGADAAHGKTRTFDTHFNYSLPAMDTVESPYPADELTEMYAQTAERILKESGISKGYCLVLGVEQGRLAYELARRSELKIVAVDSDPESVAAARAALGETPYYGLRISVHEGSLAELPYGEYLANLIVSDTMLVQGSLSADPGEVYRVLRPSGGVLYLGQPAGPRLSVTRDELKPYLREDPNDESKIVDGHGLFAVVRRGDLAGAGEWTHQYGQADNASCSRDFLVRGKMNVQWWGRPGPRPMPDRGPRNPAPLSAAGRLYIQGDRVLFGLDAYNGTVLWSKQVPVVRRANMPRDCSNMVAAGDALYVAERDHLLKIDGQTGKVERVIGLPESSKQPLDWGYLGCVGERIIASSVKQGAGYLGDFGEWYDKDQPTAIAKVTSRHLFALDRQTGQPQWDYRGGVVIQSTITIADGRVYFVESRNPAALESKEGRLIEEIRTEQFLVALDLETGNKVWEQATDLSDALRVIYLIHADDTLAVTGSSKKKYHIWAFDTKEGRPLWQDSFAMKKDHHGGAIQHPVAVGSMLYCELRGYNLRSGKLERTDLPERRGCGAMAASNYAFFYRHRFHGMWDLETNQRSEFQGIRGGCWLGQIPAGGLMLAPETSSGCSCTHSIQISVGYIPAAMTKQKQPQP